MTQTIPEPRGIGFKKYLIIFVVAVVTISIAWALGPGRDQVIRYCLPLVVKTPATTQYLHPRAQIITSGYDFIIQTEPWGPDASLEQVRRIWEEAPARILEDINRRMDALQSPPDSPVPLAMAKASCLIAMAKPNEAYDVLQKAREQLVEQGGPQLSNQLSTLMYFQGVAALRRGETENCIMCRGESSCILPIRGTAIHQFKEGSQLAIKHFMEYLEVFPDDLEVKWLLNLAHMTIGEYPDHVDKRFVLNLDHYNHSDADIGAFRDIGHLVGVNRFNVAGGSIMDDFDNDGLLDLAVTSFDATQPMSIYRNRGDGHFDDVTRQAGVEKQLGGLICVQTDYNNDGRMDIYIARGAWLANPIRPTLLRNDGDFRFTDVTADAGLLDPINSNAAQWADYDNDGWVDLFVCCEQQPHRLYRNRGNGTFEEVGRQAGVCGDHLAFGKGCTWIDYDNDDYPDLFVSGLNESSQLFHNQRDGTFANVTRAMKIDGPLHGFSCWSWDYNNDGWLDIFATSYDRSLGDVVKGLLGQPHSRASNKLFLNLEGQGFRDVTRDVGLDMVFATMGSNYGDFDNDGFLDMYLGTGDPDTSTLVPNRMFKNVAGNQFVEITGLARVGHLQKGHSVACGDWDRDGNVDIFIQMGGAVNGDKFHNILFQNPGHRRSWITIKLDGKQTNRPAIGARIKITTAGEKPLTVYRHISSGSSFGGNPLETTIGLANANRIASLEIHWPGSGMTQSFHDLDVNQAIQITESADNYRALKRERIPVPEAPVTLSDDS